ncbi:MAG: VOC family protein [Phycisphaerales bacterium]
MRNPAAPLLTTIVAFAALLGAPQLARSLAQDRRPGVETQYVEIVTPEVDATCAALAAIHAVEFGDPIPELGAARTTELAGGATIAVRAPMHDQETPVVRHYTRVDDLDAAVIAAEAAGAQIAIPGMEIPGRGRIAIYLLGGNQFGLWER